MNNQTPINQPESLSRRDARRMRRAGSSRGGALVVGVVLILLGSAFLMQSFGTYTFPFENWWALFILIPAFGAFSSAYFMYHNADNHWTAPARGSLLVGFVLTLVAAGFLLKIDWTYYGPILIILSGVGVLVNAAIGTRE